MVGRRFWWLYLTDSGKKYAVELDENIGEVFGFDPVEMNTPEVPLLPTGFKMRVVNSRSRTTGQPRAFPVGKPTIAIYSGATREFGYEGQFYDITGVRGERARRAKGRNL